MVSKMNRVDAIISKVGLITLKEARILCKPFEVANYAAIAVTPRIEANLLAAIEKFNRQVLR